MKRVGATAALFAAVLVRAEVNTAAQSAAVAPAVLGPCSLFSCQTAQLPARGSRAIHTYWRPTSFARANGTVGQAPGPPTLGRAGDNVFSIFLPIPADSAQNCARKRVGWRRQGPPRPRVAVGFRLQGGSHPPRRGGQCLAGGAAPGSALEGVSPKGAEETTMESFAHGHRWPPSPRWGLEILRPAFRGLRPRLSACDPSGQ